MEKKEVRSIDSKDAEVRALRRGRTIEGYAIVFNRESKDLGGFKEVILPEAIDGVLERSDILALVNHNQDKGVLARSTKGEGTLQLSVDNYGVKYRFDAPETAVGDEVLWGVRHGDIRTSSFSFSVSAGQKWEKREDDSYLRTISKFDELYDVSPVYREAYADTTVAVRSLVELRTSEAEKAASEAAKRIADLEEELRKKDAEKAPTDAVAEDHVEVKEEVKEEVKKPSYAELEKYFKELEEKIK